MYTSVKKQAEPAADVEQPGETTRDNPHQATPAQDGSGRLYLLAINEEGFVFDPTTGESFTVNGTGLEILKGLKEKKSLEEIAERITELYTADKDEAERDAADFMDQLRSINLL